jgi:hypothetical protein
MNLSDLASIGSLAGGLAVVVSLLFVGFQLRQNTLAVRAETSQSHAGNWAQITTPITEYADFARIWRRGLDGLAALTEDERARFVAFSSGVFRFFEASRLQWRHGQLDAEHWQNVEAFLKDIANRPGIIDFWALRRHLHSTEFRTWFESLPRAAPAARFYDMPVKDRPGPQSAAGAPPAPMVRRQNQMHGMAAMVSSAAMRKKSMVARR